MQLAFTDKVHSQAAWSFPLWMYLNLLELQDYYKLENQSPPTGKNFQDFCFRQFTRVHFNEVERESIVVRLK